MSKFTLCFCLSFLCLYFSLFHHTTRLLCTSFPPSLSPSFSPEMGQIFAKKLSSLLALRTEGRNGGRKGNWNGAAAAATAILLSAFSAAAAPPLFLARALCSLSSASGGRDSRTNGIGSESDRIRVFIESNHHAVHELKISGPVERESQLFWNHSSFKRDFIL